MLLYLLCVPNLAAAILSLPLISAPHILLPMPVSGIPFSPPLWKLTSNPCALILRPRHNITLHRGLLRNLPSQGSSSGGHLLVRGSRHVRVL